MPKSVKKLAAGNNITIKLPVDITHDVLAFINQEREVSRNKFLASALINGLKDKMQEELKQVKVTLPLEVTEDQRKQLNSPHVERALAAFAQTIIGTGTMPLIHSVPKSESELEVKTEKDVDQSDEELDFSIYDDLLPPDDE
ncbi:hypothetical protein IHV10_22260 [Fictibacillus sp. 5RED26]|uniref:hypothetical protein n=1 Tax=Fictibacillus sp. 5RED26 TaxID=2745876 RepID=UPI0018CF876B|nr:hypothetical protein [Fictibacillus sp. 5RED26]MBH0159097.1 hypothetical protein [Fictibacillus sp. 5RED26]